MLVTIRRSGYEKEKILDGWSSKAKGARAKVGFDIIRL